MNKMEEVQIQSNVKVYEAMSSHVKARLEVIYDKECRRYSIHLRLCSFERYANGRDDEFQSVDIRDAFRHPLAFMKKLNVSQLALEVLVDPEPRQTFSGLRFDIRPMVAQVIDDLTTYVYEDFGNKNKKENG